MEQHLVKVMAGTYFLRLNYKICWDPWAAPSHVKQILISHGSWIPGSAGGREEPGSFVFGLSGCHVALGARAMLCDLSHLADPSVCMAHGGPVFERKAYLTFFCLPKNSIKRDSHLNWSAGHVPLLFFCWICPLSNPDWG